MRLALIIEYDGTGYHGFQYQENAPSVQEELEAAIKQLTGARPRIKGAGRTDAGVHAAGQVAAFDTESVLPPETFVRGMNHYLPDDIAVKAAYRVADEFDPRRHALARAYRYTVLNRATRSPLARRRALQVEEPLDVAAMHEAAQAFVGVHDFARFSGPLEREEASPDSVADARQSRHTVRRIYAASVRSGLTPTSISDRSRESSDLAPQGGGGSEASVRLGGGILTGNPSPFSPDASGLKASPSRGEEEGDDPLTLVPTPVGTGLSHEGREHPSTPVSRGEGFISFDVEGNAFLPHQVRRMAGALVDVGKRRLSVEDIIRMLESGTDGPLRQAQGGLTANTLPPQGLCLMEVKYGDFPPTGGEERKDANKELQPTGVRP